MDGHTYRGSTKFEDAGGDEGVSNSGGVTCASDTTVGVYGSWVELIASTARDAQMAIVHCGPRSSTSGLGAHVRIGVGASTAEKTRIEGMLVQTWADELAVASYPCPIFIPAGTRLSASVTDNSTSALNCDVSVTLCQGGPWPGAPLQFNEMDDGGGAGFGYGVPDPGGSANTKGAWDELVAATSFDWKAMIVYISQNAAAMGDDNWMIDIGIGAAAAEKVKIPNLRSSAGIAKDTMRPGVIGPFKVDIPRGTRITDRCQSTDITATVRLPRVSILGFG